MEWQSKNRTTVTHCSGLSIEIQQGSFSEPYRINVIGGGSLGAIEKVGLIREGMKFGAGSEIKIAVEDSYSAPLDLSENTVPKIVYKRRPRQVTPGSDRGDGSVTQ